MLMQQETSKQIDELKAGIEELKGDTSTQIDELKTEVDELKEDTPNQINELKAEIEELKALHTEHVMLRRKDVGNPINFFEKTFAEYQQGFEANGKLWKTNWQSSGMHILH